MQFLIVVIIILLSSHHLLSHIVSQYTQEYEKQKAVLEQGLAVDSTNADLQKMLESVNATLEYRKLYSEIILKAPESDTNLEYLGGLPSSGGSKIPPSTSYAQLDRRPLPPLSKNHKVLSQFDDKLKPMVESFFGGELIVKWLAKEDQLSVEGYVPGEIAPVISYYAKSEDIGNGQVRSMSAFNTKQNSKYHKRLTKSEKDMLKIVMLQRLFRAKGAQIEISEKSLKDLIENLSNDCLSERLYKDSVDLKLIFADISCNRGFEGFNYTVIHMGEDMESAKKYEEAGKLYAELADPTKFKQHPKIPRSILHGYAALAFKRAQDYVSAEREYVTALREAGPDWSSEVLLPGRCVMNDELQINETINNMMIFYEIAQEQLYPASELMSST